MNGNFVSLTRSNVCAKPEKVSIDLFIELLLSSKIDAKAQ